jgi:hypothetical protein
LLAMRPLDHHVGVLVDCRLAGPACGAWHGRVSARLTEIRAEQITRFRQATRRGLDCYRGMEDAVSGRQPEPRRRVGEQPAQACTRNHLDNGAQRCRCPGGDAEAGARPGAVIGRRGREAGRQAILTQGHLPPGDMAAAGKWQPRSIRKRDKHQVPPPGRMRDTARPVFPSYVRILKLAIDF